MGLSEDQEREVARIADLKVREYFDVFLRDVLPIREKAIKAHTHVHIEKHNDARDAHGGVEKAVSQSRYWLAGAVAVSTFAGPFVAPLVVKWLRGA